MRNEDDWEPESPDEKIAGAIQWWVDGKSTQAELVKTLRGFQHNWTADIIAELVEGSGGWKIVLKRSRRGAPESDPGYGAFVLRRYREEMSKRPRGALKRVARHFRATPAAVRSAIRRAVGTHSTDRKRKSGRK